MQLSRKSSHADLASANVIGVLPGTDPVAKDEYVVVAAHLDHLGGGAPVGGDAICLTVEVDLTSIRTS